MTTKELIVAEIGTLNEDNGSCFHFALLSSYHNLRRKSTCRRL
jgi:hypothetical protein